MMSRDIDVRPALEDDIDAVVHICRTSMVATYGDFFDRETLEPWAFGDEVPKYVRRTWSKMLVAESGGQVVGVVARDGKLIDLLWVDLDWRGRGVGSILMDRAEQELACTYPTAELECFEPNTASIEFYQARGYTIVRRYLDRDSGIRKVVMHKTLTPS